MARLNGKNLIKVMLGKAGEVILGRHEGDIVYRGLEKWEKFNAVRHSNSYYTEGSWVSQGTTQGYANSEPISGTTGYRFSAETGIFSSTGSLVSMHPAYSSGVIYIVHGSGVARLSFSSGSYTSSSKSAQGPYTDTWYGKGSTSYGYVYAREGTYPDNGRGTDGYWYLRVAR